MAVLIVAQRFAGFANGSSKLSLCESGLVAYRHNAFSHMLTYLLSSHPSVLQSVDFPVLQQSSAAERTRQGAPCITSGNVRLEGYDHGAVIEDEVRRKGLLGDFV